MVTIDLNFDGGEGYDDEAIAPFVTTIHVACGGHAGDDASMRRALRLARRFSLDVGAHPSYPDAPRFGRVETGATANEIRASVTAQVRRLISLATEEGVGVSLVKPHGALYHRVSSDATAAAALLDALPGPAVVFGPPGSALLELARERGFGTAVEGFVDRRTLPDGSLVPRTRPDALLTDPDAAAEQALSLATSGRFQSLCVHGDSPGAADIAAHVFARLREAGVRLASRSEAYFREEHP